MAMHEDFDPGFDTVASIHLDARLLGRVAEHRGRLRLVAPGDLDLTFDAEGRLIAAHADGLGYRRTLDNRLLVTRHAGHGDARRSTRESEPDEPLVLLARWHAFAAGLRDALARGAAVTTIEGHDRDAVRWAEALRPAAGWNPDRLAADTDRLRDIYLPIPILPPDQYGSVVLQATEGCSFNRCSFCNFYREVAYRERPLEAFEAHVDAVLRHLGRSVENYHRVFLGQANAALLDTDTLVAMLERVQARLPLRPRDLAPAARRQWRTERAVWIDGIYSFIDSFHEPKGVEDLRRLARHGLRRVYLGLETGSQDLLRELGKPGSVDAAVALARNLHEAGVELGVIVLVGAGGLAHAAPHVQKTVNAVHAMDLRQGDQVYLSKLVIYEGSAYQQRVWQRGLTPLTPEELDAQASALRRGIREKVRAQVPVAPYDVDLSRSLFTR